MKVTELFEDKQHKQPPVSFFDWKTDKSENPKGFTSFDRYKEQYGVDEYHVVIMDPKTKYSHVENKAPLFTTDDMSAAHGHAYEHHKKTGADVGIYQPRSFGYRGRYHKQAHDGQPRDKSGKFGSRPAKEAK